MADKFERFTNEARNVLVLAQAEARRLNHNYVGTEHLLLGFLREENGKIARVFHQLGIEPGQVIRSIERTVGRGERTPFGKPMLAPRVKQVIKLAVLEAQTLGHKYIGTEHLLLGLLREGEGVGFKTLRTFVDPATIRPAILAAQGQAEDKMPTTASKRVPYPALIEALEALSIDWRHQTSETAAQAERDRLARDLHDSIKQQLFSISISAAAVHERWDKDPAGAHAALDDVQRSAQAAMVEMNALLKQLRPNPLETIGLVDALREQCEALAFRTGAEVTTFFGELPPESQLPAGAHETLFRIAQEALSNIARHARAQRVHLRLELDRQSRRLAMEIRDDGQGFDQSTITKGMGLTNMWQRTQSLQGRLEFDTTPGQGTTIHIELPLLEHKDG
ncbi:hypothetical protein BH10CHL1_BH10CHL1_49150 [soil metagenome]